MKTSMKKIHKKERKITSKRLDTKRWKYFNISSPEQRGSCHNNHRIRKKKKHESNYKLWKNLYNHYHKENAANI